ncbi:MAG: hypothetical protein IKI57_06230 [Clostridia bacterium]|nr:hypothetical protein [Clostridia bacterium]
MSLEQVCPICKCALVYYDKLDSYFCSKCNEYYYASEFVKKEENQYTGICKEIECLMCGKTTIVNSNLNLSFCPMCYGSQVNIKEGVHDFNPKFIIHFAETMDQIKKSFFEKAKADNVPQDIISAINVETVKGLFLPFYMYSISNNAITFLQTRESAGKYDADDYYFQKFEMYDESDVLVDTTRTIPNKAIKEFANYEFKKIDMLFPKHLESHFTLKPSYGGDAAWMELKKVMNEYSKNETLKYKEKNETVKELKAFNEIRTVSRKLILLPVWIFEFIKDNEKHYLYVNGQTGKMTSDIDYDHSVKTGFFSKKKTMDYQINIKESSLIKREEYSTSLDYMNQLKKYEVNKNDRLSEIRKVR